MAFTAAEKQKRRRDKLKASGSYDEFKKKHCMEQRKSYLKKKKQLQELPIRVKDKLEHQQKKVNRTKVALWRERKKQNVDIGENVYSSKIAFGKAISRAKKNLPTSPRRRLMVVRRLFASETGVTSPLFTIKNTRSSSISEEIRTIVKAFYERDDISRQAPGRKDVISVKGSDGIKVKLQTRHLISSVLEVYGMFREEYSNMDIGKSKFAELRPKNILLSNKLPHNVCLCRYHENFINAVNTLSKVSSIPSYSKQFLENYVLCKKQTKDCWTNICEDCKDGKFFREKIEGEEDDNEEVRWYVWKSHEEKTISKVLEEGTTVELKEYVTSLIPSFLKHVFVKRKQSLAYQTAKEKALSGNFDKEKAMIQVDFSENYTCVSQDEVQSAHWQKSQISLFTSCLWYTGSMHPVVIVSDNTDHSKDTIVAYIDRLLETIPDHIKEVSIWSDGPASQFKNRFIAAAINSLQEKHHVHLQWNFLATSHGKGPIDGIGGAIKRKVWELVKRRTYSVQSAVQFMKAANHSPTIKIIEITAEEIFLRNEKLNLKAVFESAVPIEGISKYHCFLIRDEKPACFLLSEDVLLMTVSVDTEIKEGDWYEVEYDGKLYPGEVKKITRAHDYLVSAMEPSGSYWKWPVQPDEVFYKREKLVRKLSLPFLMNSRGQYKFI